MRGKSIDFSFLSDFTSSCCNRGKTSPDEICGEARKEIDDIDNQIRQIESLKSRRAKLVDVLTAFGADRFQSTEVVTSKNFSKVDDLDKVFAQAICSKISEDGIELENLISIYGDSFRNKVILTVKKLGVSGVLGREGKKLVPGPNWDELNG